jgi:RNA polymerase sigma factor (sigma-70 family)
MTPNPAALFRRVAAEAADPDGVLLARFAADRDDAAFAELVRRHGPLVFGVCRRTVGHVQDAEDAFQATFLVLAQKAGRITRPELLGNWLYGVAARVAGKARRRVNRRAARERTGVAMPDPPTRPVKPADETLAVIDAEIARLPGVYRDAILLCDVQGVPRPEAAQRLGVLDGTLSSRLANGRKKLAARLAGRGLAPPAAGALLVAVPDALANRTIDTAVAALAGTAVPYSVIELTRTGGSVMRYALGAAVLTVAGLAAGAAAWPQGTKPESPKKAEVAATQDPVAEKKAEESEIRPRRLKTVELTYAATNMVWSSDGRYLAVTGPKTCTVIDTKTYESADTTELGHRVVGFVPGTSTLVTRRWDRGRINGQNQLIFWSVTNQNPGTAFGPGFGGVSRHDQFWLKIDRRLELGDEQAEWIHLLPGGKTCLTLHAEPLTFDDLPANDADRRAINQEYRKLSVRILDLTNGSQLREFSLGLTWLKGFAVTPDGTKVLVLTAEKQGYRVQCRSTTDGTVIWDQEVAKNKQHSTSNNPFRVDELKLNEKQAALILGPHIWPDTGKPGLSRPGAELQVIDTASGKPVPLQPDVMSLSGQSGISTATGGFSPDGRLIAVSLRPFLLQIWDVTTGKRVKQWSGDATTSFAPNRPILAILESVTESDEASKSVTRSSLGFWDCSPPAK